MNTFEAAERLYRLDDEMQVHYDGALALYTAQLDPIIHAEFDGEGGTYHLRRHGKLTSVQPVPPQYRILKSISHTPLGIYSIIAQTPWQKKLKEFATYLKEGLDSLDHAALPADRVEDCRALLAAGLGYCEKTLTADVVDMEQYTAYAHYVSALLKPNIEAAAALQVDAFEELVKGWRAEMGEEEWSRLMVVVTCAWAMRRENVHMQIFEHLMGKDAVNQRLIIAEGFNDTKQAFELLGRIVLDRSVSKTVFEDPLALDVELMGAGALKRIEDYACPVYPSIKGPQKPYYTTEMP